MKILEIEKGEFINLDNVNEIVFKKRERAGYNEACAVIVTFSNGTTKEWLTSLEKGESLEKYISQFR